MDPAFQLLAPPRLDQVAPFRFVHEKKRGPYEPWVRVQALDNVAEALERIGVERNGPAFGIYHDLPSSDRDPAEWTALLGYPVADAAVVPRVTALRVADVPEVTAVGLRYRGDLSSFPTALGFLMDWANRRGIEVQGPLMERFYVSNAMTLVEERDVFVAVAPFELAAPVA